MRLARVIRVLNRRRDWIIDRLAKASRSDQASSWIAEEKKAIEHAIPVLEAELDRRQLAVMQQRVASDERLPAGAT